MIVPGGEWTTIAPVRGHKKEELDRIRYNLNQCKSEDICDNKNHSPNQF